MRQQPKKAAATTEIETHARMIGLVKCGPYLEARRKLSNITQLLQKRIPSYIRSVFSYTLSLL
jgi:hypothetical protein